MHHTLQASKATPHEESIHIPFILKYPRKVKNDQRTDILFSSVDVLPTLLGLCEIAIPEDIQGIDLSHVVLGSNSSGPESIYLQILGPGWPPRVKWVGLWRGVRTYRYTYARWKDRSGLRILYDREKDPFELQNLINNPEYASIVIMMEQQLQRWIERTNDPFDTGERLPQTEMLDLGQKFTSDHWYNLAPNDYVTALKKGSGYMHQD
jgi:arylsulfatase A-like enzyme